MGKFAEVRGNCRREVEGVFAGTKKEEVAREEGKGKGSYHRERGECVS